MNKTSSIYKVVTFGLWALLALVVCLFMAWKIAGGFQFFYSSAYQLLKIDQTIAEYAPQNRYRSHFPATAANVHIEMFSAISDAILQNGEGLANIEYKGTDGKDYTLLHQAEVLHLEDVSRLIIVLEKAGWVAMFLWIALTVAIFWLWKWSMPSFVSLIGSVIGFTVVAVVTVLLAGSEKVFYNLHIYIFPSDHQWFFYYQDSLMTTIMKAPDLFAYIAVILLTITLVLFVGLFVLTRFFSSLCCD